MLLFDVILNIYLLIYKKNMSSQSWVVWLVIIIMLLICIGIIILFYLYEQYPKKLCHDINHVDNEEDLLII